MEELLKQRGCENIQVFGGGVIVPEEIRMLASHSVRIFSPEDGQRMGLASMIGEMVIPCDKDFSSLAPKQIEAIQGHTEMSWARWRS